ncbi:MAG: O-antigen ligase family protein, partial [Vicinamibacterales bacterium]
MLGLMLLAVGTQLVPMPRDAAEGINGAAAKADYAGLSAAVLGNADRPQDSEASSRYRAISIAPSRTALGLVFVAIVVGLFITCARAMSVVGHRTTVRGIVVLGVVVAFLQLIQSASGSDVVYGFWVPPTEKGHHSAPFLNRNHTAGWLLMALSVSLGRFAGLMSQWPLAGRRWRQRLLSLSDAGPSEAVLTAVGVGVMAVAIVSTASRSGLACLAVAVAMAVAWSGRARLSIPRRAAVALYAIAALLFALSQDVVARVVGRLSTTTWTTLDGRLDVWRDSLDIIRDTPWVGTGLNTYGIAMLHYQTVDDGLQYIEAHNDYLQLFAEGGLLLVIPLVLVLLFFVREVRRRFREGADTA